MIEFEIKNKQKVNIIKDGETVGHIYSPAGSSSMSDNAIQICGFSEAYDLWGCAAFKGFKDIQLLFDGKKMDGQDSIELGESLFDNCIRCYRKPCQCEQTKDQPNPFAVKRESMIKERIESITENMISKIPVKDRTTRQHHFMIKEAHNGSVRNYLLSMGEFKDVPIDED